MDPHVDQLPQTLLDLLSNPIIADNLLQYLSLQSLFRLSRTARLYRDWVLHTPKVFRYLDLSHCRGAYTPNIPRVDHGGFSWRAERIDENLTEDDFFAGPLRNVLNQLDRKNILQDVNVLVLDRLASVTHDLLFEILTESKYNVKLLSIRQCPNVNQNRLQQLLTYICRPTRPEGTPKLQGLYFFTDPCNDVACYNNSPNRSGITTSDGATLGLLPSEKSQIHNNNAEIWYASSGRVVSIGADTRTGWEETIAGCQGIIAFDAVLCKAMHAHMKDCLHDASRDYLSANKPGVAPIASIALGPDGCSGCGKAPEGAPIWDRSDMTEFPLLAPAPRSGKLIDAIRPPPVTTSTSNNGLSNNRLIVSCKWCLVNRHCDSCHRWWCSECYNPIKSNRLRDLEALSEAMQYMPTPQDLQASSRGEDGTKGDSIKVFNGFCVENCLVGEMMAGAGSNGMWA